MATSCAVYPSSPSHFMKSPESSFCGGDWVDSPNPHMSGAPQASTSTATPRRPKLSLNTTCSRSLGHSSGLRLDTLSAMSPTVRNTYANGFEDAQHHVQTATSVARMVLPKVTPHQISRFEYCVLAEESTTADLPTMCSLMVDSGLKDTASNIVVKTLTQPRAIPYNHPSNLRSILANSPLLDPSMIKRSTFSTNNSVSTDASSTVLKRKRVCFADQLVEEINTETYTVGHFDLPSRTPSPAPCHSIVTASIDVEVTSSSDTTNIYHGESKPARVVKLTRKHEEVDEEESRVIAQTPVGGRRKRQRDWVWTLGPVEQEETRCDASPPVLQPNVVEEPSTECSADVGSISITSQVFDALKPAAVICEAVKDLASSNGLVSGMREIVDGYFGLSN